MTAVREEDQIIDLGEELPVFAALSSSHQNFSWHKNRKAAAGHPSPPQASSERKKFNCDGIFR